MTRLSDLGQGAGFYVNATQDPWAKHFRMWDYIAQVPIWSLTNFRWTAPRRASPGIPWAVTAR